MPKIPEPKENKFMQTLPSKEMNVLKREAHRLGITVQELVRVRVIPDWMEKNGLLPKA